MIKLENMERCGDVYGNIFIKNLKIYRKNEKYDGRDT